MDKIRAILRSGPRREGLRYRGKEVVVVTTEAALTSSIEALSDGTAILVLSGEIDLATAPKMVARFQELADKGLTNVVIDAREVRFIATEQASPARATGTTSTGNAAESCRLS